MGFKQIEEQKALTRVAIPLARDNLPGLVRNLTSNAITKFHRKISRKEAIKPKIWFTWFISKKHMNDIIKIIKSLKDSAVLIDEVTEKVKRKINEQRGRFLGDLLAPLAPLLAHFIITTSNFSTSKTDKWKRS